MKQEDFERLKAVCEKEGFNISSYRESDKNGMLIHIKPKYIWEGVEFVQSISSCTTQWKTYKVKQITQRSVWIEIDDNGSTTTSLLIEKCKPSTESAYLEQLKKEAFERLGDIKEGDRFHTDFDNETFIIDDDYGFDYKKRTDTLFFSGWSIYTKGQWATKVQKRIEVKFDGGNIQQKAFYFLYGSDAEKKIIDLQNTIGEFLANQLEKYLNNEIND
jgi:hypothetical protein